MAHGNGLNGSVAVPRWLIGLVPVVLAAIIAWAVQDRRAIGEQLDVLRERVTGIEETRFREADGLRLEQRLRIYVDEQIRRHHGGNEP